jgi:hypothetical protein
MLRTFRGEGMKEPRWWKKLKGFSKLLLSSINMKSNFSFCVFYFQHSRDVLGDEI